MIENLFLLIIKPIIFLLENIFVYFYDLSSKSISLGLVIAIMSFIVSILCLPFYLKAENQDKAEKEVQNKMADRINAIKKNFKGDERYFLLKTCYRQNHYHPIMSLRLSLSLLLQIPFFLAAYIFFSYLEILDGASFLFIKDLAEPDNLLNIANLKINFLPILMTIINLAAGFVYVGNLSFKKNKTLVIMSLIFLVLLYNSPAGLVFYWTCNNIFSLFKNICLKYLNIKQMAQILIFISAIGYPIILGLYEQKHNIMVYVLIALYFLMLVDFSKYKNKLLKIKPIIDKFTLKDFPIVKLFYISAIFMWLLVGVFIPSKIISSSPAEFLFETTNISYELIYETAVLYLGLFVFWGSCIFFVLDKNEKKYISFGYCVLCILAFINLFYWRLPHIPLLNNFTFNSKVEFNSDNIFKYILYYILVLVIICSVNYLIKNKYKILQNAFVILIISLMLLCCKNLYEIKTAIAIYLKTPQNYTTASKLINLSSKKKNVVIIFLDREVSFFFPMMLKEKPELKEKYRGFKYYPNTLSFAQYSIMGYHPMMGGYEYSPIHIDERKIEFTTKHNESLAVLPALFSEKGYDTRIIKSQGEEWGIYMAEFLKQEYNDFRINPLYKKYSTQVLMPPPLLIDINTTDKQIEESKRNIRVFVLLPILPNNSKNYLYNEGKYHNIEKKHLLYSESTIQTYRELEELSNFTDFKAQNNTFTIFNSFLPHNPCVLAKPEYKLIKNENENIGSQDVNYNVNIAALILVGNWLDYLKEKGVYDNTRIIIVSDHGFDLINNNISDFLNKNFTPFNPLLLVKDFNSNDDLKFESELMTNADTPFIALKGINDHPINPFTNKLMTDKDKEMGLYIKTDRDWLPQSYLGKETVLKESDKFNFIKNNPNYEKNWRINIPYKLLPINNKGN